MKRLTILNMYLVLVLVSPVPVTGQVMEEIAKSAAEATFSAAERQLIKKYYEATGQTQRNEEDDDQEERPNKAKGNANNKNNGKRPDLPRGIVKKLERGGTLPPGMEKRPLAVDLERQLPEVPDGFERVESEGKVILRNVATGVITDIIDVIARQGNVPVDDRESGAERVPDRNSDAQQTERKWWQFWK